MGENLSLEITKRRKKLKKLFGELLIRPFPPVPIPDFFGEFVEIDAVIAGLASTYSDGAEDDKNLPTSDEISDEEIIANCEKSIQDALRTYKPSSDKEKRSFEEFLARISIHNEIIKNIKEIIELKKKINS